MPWYRGTWIDEEQMAGVDEQAMDKPPTDTPPPINIKGYGSRAIVETAPGSGRYKTQYGEMASTDYVDDIEQTLRAVESGEMSDAQLNAKIRKQQGIPERPPTDAQLNALEKWNDFKNTVMSDIKIDPKWEYEKAKNERSRSIWSSMDAADQSMLKPEQRLRIEDDIERYGVVARDKAQARVDKELEVARQFFEKQWAKESQQATEWGLRERAAQGDLVAIKALKQSEGEKKAENDLKREISDKDLYKPLINNLPKTKEEAVQANVRVEKYKHLSSLAEKGAGGLIPGLKAFLAPVGEAMGMDVSKMSEAQVFQLMARAAVGSQRLMLVGSGQVSNYEQDLMQRLSGGSIKTSREAAKKLFEFYINESKGIVDAYDTQIDNLSEKYPDVKKMYGYIGRGKGNQKTIKRTGTLNGKRVVEYSDGSVEYAP